VGKKAIRNYLPRQAGDMAETWADIEAIKTDLGYNPTTNIETGVARFVEWYKEYYKDAGPGEPVR
jgi:UDP-glucuronate 4-epimerase